MQRKKKHEKRFSTFFFSPINKRREVSNDWKPLNVLSWNKRHLLFFWYVPEWPLGQISPTLFPLFVYESHPPPMCPFQTPILFTMGYRQIAQPSSASWPTPWPLDYCARTSRTSKSTPYVSRVHIYSLWNEGGWKKGDPSWPFSFSLIFFLYIVSKLPIQCPEMSVAFFQRKTKSRIYRIISCL